MGSSESCTHLCTPVLAWNSRFVRRACPVPGRLQRCGPQCGVRPATRCPALLEWLTDYFAALGCQQRKHSGDRHFIPQQPYRSVRGQKLRPGGMGGPPVVPKGQSHVRRVADNGCAFPWLAAKAALGSAAAAEKKRLIPIPSGREIVMRVHCLLAY